MTLKKLLGAGVLSLALVGMSVVPASAATIELSNSITGSGSRNVNRVFLRHRFDVDNDFHHRRFDRLFRDDLVSFGDFDDFDRFDRFGRRFDRFDFRFRNDVDIDNRINVRASTGGNRIIDNTIVGDIETGDIDLSIDIEN